MLDNLNSNQLLAVTTTEGPVMVMAGAGSGKTRVLTERIAHLICDCGISPYNIMAVTFTNKAANEMKKRISSIVGFDTKAMWVSTFHSFCSRLLRLEIEDNLPPFTHSFVIIDEEDGLRIIKNILKESLIDEIKPKKIKDLISKSKSFPNFKINDPYLSTIFNSVKSKYNIYLKDNNMLDFDDLLIKTIELFQKNTNLLTKYQEKFMYILVDEFQDTNELQYKLIYMLASRYRNIFVVGDDFQSIYSFRGAKLENIKKFREDFLGTELILLEENYRSTKQILNLANTIIDKNPNQIKKVMFSNKKEGSLPFYYEAINEKSEAMFVIDKIKEFHLEGDQYSNFAIIYRTNYISRVFEDMLIKYQIPYRIYGGLSFFSRKEIKDMVAYLRVIVFPKDDFSFSRIVNEPKRKIGSKILEKLANHASNEGKSLFEAIDTFEESGVGSQALKVFFKMICSIREQLNNIPLKNVIDILVEESGYKAMLAIDDPEHERIGNIFELKNVIKEIDDTVSGDNFDKLASFLEDLSLRTDNENEKNVDSVVLTTYHQVKGLEFKNVFMVAMEEGIFPSEYHIDDLDIEEERRICYVGITRAMDRLYVTNARSRMLYGRSEVSSPSRFIKEMGSECIKNITDHAAKKSTFNYKDYLRKSTKENPPVKNTDSYSIGDKVEHNVFGKGIIVSTTETSIKVAFASPYGIKLMAKNHPSYHKI